MFVKRNDPCSCGSGKKYKKCCLKKESILHSLEIKEDRSSQQRQALLKKVNKFLDRKLSIVEYSKLAKLFKMKTANQIQDKSYIYNWLSFFYRFEQGYGIEWFLLENKGRLSKPEKELVSGWLQLKPRILEIVDKNVTHVTFADAFTKEQFSVSLPSEQANKTLPWSGVVGYLMNENESSYFLGESQFLDPCQTKQAIQHVEDLLKDTNHSYQEVLKENYIDVLSTAYINKQSCSSKKEKEVEQYTLTYKILDESYILNHFKENNEYKIDVWNTAQKSLKWVGNKKVYMDNEVSGKVYIEDIFGQVTIQDAMLQFTCYERSLLESFTLQLKRMGSILLLIDEQLHSFSIPYNADFKNKLVSVEEQVPEYFSLYAEQSLELDINRPLLAFGELTLAQMVEIGRLGEIDTWLKHSEYNLYRLIQSKFNEVMITPDFNTIRKKLGLTLSAFVTGGENRVSSIQSSVEKEMEERHVSVQDKSYYEDLGFDLDTLEFFFTNDLVDFYIEKTDGKSDNTIRKYRLSLIDLRELLSKQILTDWNDLNIDSWKNIIIKDYFDLYEATTKTQVKDFLSTLKALAKWLDKKYNLSISEDITQIIKEQEDCIAV